MPGQTNGEAPQISPPVLRFGAFFPRPAGTAGAPSPRALARCCGRMGAKGSKDNASETEEAVSVAPPTAAEPTQPGCPRCGLPGEGAGAFCQCRSCKTYMSHTQLYSRVEPLVPKKKGPQVDPQRYHARPVNRVSCTTRARARTRSSSVALARGTSRTTCSVSCHVLRLRLGCCKYYCD